MSLSPELIDEICDTCPANHYCTLKELLIISNIFHDQRLIIQLKCIEIFKYEESERTVKDIGWEVATTRWVTGGYAKQFDIEYSKLSLNKQFIQPKRLYRLVRKLIDKT